ncbi:hypothetical protein [Leifsonia aquatica]|uniref:hypothetical protein n=1 Tax=Leifsonia aquatica TaxID=144185 RepID=UPI0037F7F996
MQLRGWIQSSVVDELTAEADDAETARAAIEEQVPDGFDLLQVHHAMPRGGRVIATGTIRPARVDEIESSGTDYASARAELLRMIPDGWRLLSTQIIDS